MPEPDCCIVYLYFLFGTGELLGSNDGSTLCIDLQPENFDFI